MERDIRWLRNGAIIAFVLCMGLILSGGYFAAQQVPPMVDFVAGADVGLHAEPPEGVGRANSLRAGSPASAPQVVISREQILAGQRVFHKYGLMDHGSIWGIGTYRGMDFQADTLHRIGQAMRDYYASSSAGASFRVRIPRGQLLGEIAAPSQVTAGAYAALPVSEQRSIDGQVIEEIKTNRYDSSANTITLSPAWLYAYERIRDYWNEEFSRGDPHVGFLPDTIAPAQERRDIAAFFFWTSWASGTNRPGLDYTYTSNWPADASVGNTLPPQTILWSILSILGMLAVLGVVVYVVHRWRFFYGQGTGVEAAYRLMETPVTPSQRATGKYFLVAVLLFVVQILNGGLLANYTVHPATFYVKMIGENYSYAWAKTWHVQLAILWIALAWIGTAIYVGPLIAGGEPKRQKLLTNLLFLAAFIVVIGSMLGEVLSIKGLSGDWWYWLGHQGWEYLELGRLWQILLFIGLLFWLVIVYRTLLPVLRRKDEGHEQEDRRALVVFYMLSAILVVLFFGFGLFYGRDTHPTIADYWRWFVVHIWVESIFEFFGVAVVALFLVTLGLVSARSALRVAYLTAILVFLGGIPGVAHHYFWFGGPGFWLAIGGMFSSLETIPLILLIVRAWMEYRSIRNEGGTFPYRWPLYFLVASSVWNFVGACIFGFIINLPVVNYFEHGTYLTANHAHTALFGVYGMLAISLLLFSWRGLVERKYWSDKILKLSFWGMNFGLTLMFATSLLPIGLMQVSETARTGVWYSRSAAFYENPTVQAWAMWRIVPDMIIIVLGALPLLYFLVTTYPRLRKAGSGI